MGKNHVYVITNNILTITDILVESD